MSSQKSISKSTKLRSRSKSKAKAQSEWIKAEEEEEQQALVDVDDDNSSSAASGSLKEWKERGGKKAVRIGAALLGIAMLTVFSGIMSVVIFNEIDLWPLYPEFQVSALSSPQINISTDNLVTATWELKLLVVNPNRKLSIKFEDLQVMLAYRSWSKHTAYMLAAKQVPPPPYLNPGNQTTLEFKLETLNSCVNPDLASKISDSAGSVMMGVKVLCRWGFDTQRFDMHNKTRLEKMCQWVQFQFHTNNGSWTDGRANPSRDCIF